MADELTAVQVELTRPTPPKAVLAGHLQEVTCVAVTRGPLPRIVSGSEEGIVRIWERVPGEDRWQQRMRLNLFAPVRAVACTGPGAKKNLLLTATSTGQVRLWELDNLDARSTGTVLGKDEDKARHQGAVVALAFSADGTLCASAGEDRSICVWNVPQAELLDRKRAAHKATITSLAFTPDGRLVSAGRDRLLAVWKLADDKLTEEDSLTGRSGDVSVLGLDPKGNTVLFDEGRELRVLTLDGHRIEGSLTNPGATGTFSTMALFAPDGRTILTNGNGPGRLQLWRAPSATNRAAELRQLLWAGGTATCGAFDPSGQFAVTGTSDSQVLVWELPKKDEAEKPLPGQLSYVEEFLDTGLKQVTVRATLLNAPDWVIPARRRASCSRPGPPGSSTPSRSLILPLAA
jgi:WD40 repeat protein